MAGGRRLGKGADHWALDSPNGAPREPWPGDGFYSNRDRHRRCGGPCIQRSESHTALMIDRAGSATLWVV